MHHHLIDWLFLFYMGNDNGKQDWVVSSVAITWDRWNFSPNRSTPFARSWPFSVRLLAISWPGRVTAAVIRATEWVTRPTDRSHPSDWTHRAQSNRFKRTSSPATISHFVVNNEYIDAILSLSLWRQPQEDCLYRYTAYTVYNDSLSFDYVYTEYHYRVTIVISDTLESVQHGGDRGWLSIQLHGDVRSSPPTRLTSEYITIHDLYILLKLTFFKSKKNVA